MTRKKTTPVLRKSKSHAAVMSVPSKEILEYVKFFNRNGLRELVIKERGVTISMGRNDQPAAETPVAPVSVPVQTPPAEAKDPVPVPPEDDKYEKVTTPIVGTFYESSSPDSPPFVDTGKTVNKGDTLCIIEAMKVMNKITADQNMKIIQKVAKNEESVKAGDVLFLVEST